MSGGVLDTDGRDRGRSTERTLTIRRRYRVWVAWRTTGPRRLLSLVNYAEALLRPAEHDTTFRAAVAAGCGA